MEGEILHSTRCCTGCATLCSSNTAAVLRRWILGTAGSCGVSISGSHSTSAPQPSGAQLLDQRLLSCNILINSQVYKIEQFVAFWCYLPSLPAAPEEKQGSYRPRKLLFLKNSPKHASLPNWTGDPGHVFACIHQAATLLENVCRQDCARSLL